MTLDYTPQEVPISNFVTSVPPSSALATQIAISSPAAAVRASSLGPAASGLRSDSNGMIQITDASASSDQASLTRIQQAEEMGRRQQAQIGALLEAQQRQVARDVSCTLISDC